MVDFSLNKEERELIDNIADRAMREFTTNATKLHFLMDITAAHCNGCRLKLHELLEADTTDFLHDVGGICGHLDRETGELEDFFEPRYAA